MSCTTRTLTPMVLQIIQWLDLGDWSKAAWLNYVAPLVSVAL